METDTSRTRGGAKIVSAHKISESYVRHNVDVSKVAPDDRDYILKLCTVFMQYAERSDLYFKVRDDTSHYTISIANWDGNIIFTDYVARFHAKNCDPLLQNILSTAGNFVTGQIDVMVEKRGIVTGMLRQHRRALDTPYAGSKNRMPGSPVRQRVPKSRRHGNVGSTPVHSKRSMRPKVTSHIGKSTARRRPTFPVGDDTLGPRVTPRPGGRAVPVSVRRQSSRISKKTARQHTRGGPF